MSEGNSSGDARAGRLVQAGTMRVALFLPQYETDAKTGAIRGLGTGYAAEQIAPLLAQRLGIAIEMMGYPGPGKVVDALKAGECDIAFLGIEPSRISQVDFSPAIVEFDYAFLVPAGSAISRPEEADKPEVTIAIVEGHASSMALAKLFHRAAMLAAKMPDAAFENLRAGKAQAFAAPRDVLEDYALKLPGSRVLAEAYGANRIGIAIRQGDPGLRAVIAEFVDELKASGFVARLVKSEHLRGFRVAR
jgi:polar amino acid transport system substrate-binding protein